MADDTALDQENQTLPSQPRPLREVRGWDIETDVVVVGLGVAGGAAAIETTRAGAQVVILERAAAGGGATAESGGQIYFGGGTRVQKACGFEDTPDDMCQHLLDICGPDNEAKVRLYCERSVEHFDWFVALGLEFKDSFYPHKAATPETDDGVSYSGNEAAYPFNQRAKPVPRGHKPKQKGDAGALIMQAILAGVSDSGARTVTEALCETLVTREDGRVAGVVASVDGEERLVKARRGVILAAGGFIKNKQMLAKHAPQLLRCNYPLGTDGDDGRGIRMGMGAGGNAIHMAEAFISIPFYPPAAHVKGILVNGQGQRFVNEDSYHGRCGDFVVNHQDGVAYLIVDNELYGPTVAMHKIVAVEETIEALEKALGFSEATLTATVEFFNRHAATGEDPLFHKAPEYLRPLETPPYSALNVSVKKSIIPAFTLGGLETLPTGEVLTPDGKAIPGLYAAGRTTAGLPRSAATYASGLSIADGSFFGRMAGISAANAKQW